MSLDKKFAPRIFLDHKISQIVQKQKKLATHHNRKLNCTELISQKDIVIGSADGSISLWDLKTKNYKSSFKGHKGEVLCLAYCKFLKDKMQILSSSLTSSQFQQFHQKSPNYYSDYLVSGGTDKNTIVWNLQDEKDVIVIKGHEDSVTAVLGLPDYQSLVTGSLDRKIILWDLQKQSIKTILPCNGSILQFQYVKDYKRFVSSDASQVINIWSFQYESMPNFGKNKIENILLDRVILTNCIVLSLESSFSNKNIIFGGCDDSSIKIWDLQNTQWQNVKGAPTSYQQNIKTPLANVAEIALFEFKESTQSRLKAYLIAIGSEEKQFLIYTSENLVFLDGILFIIFYFSFKQFQKKFPLIHQKYAIFIPVKE